jgi:putative tricarboxylic transport membrane protein
VKYDAFSGAALAIVGSGASLLAYELGLGDLREPGTGLIPFAVAALLALMSLGLVIKSSIARRVAAKPSAVFQGTRWRNLILVILSLLGYGIAFNVLGFNLCNALFMMLLLWQIGRRRWWVILANSMLITAAVYLVFVYWLGCEFPKGLTGI